MLMFLILNSLPNGNNSVFRLRQQTIPFLDSVNKQALKTQNKMSKMSKMSTVVGNLEGKFEQCFRGKKIGGGDAITN